MTVLQLTETAHQINRLFHHEMDDYSLLEWEHLPEEEQAKLIEQVTVQMYKPEPPQEGKFFALVVHELKKYINVDAGASGGVSTNPLDNLNLKGLSHLNPQGSE